MLCNTTDGCRTTRDIVERRLNMIYLFFSIILLSPLIFITIINLRKRIKRKENVGTLLAKNRIFLFILICAIIGLALARIKFHMDYGI